MKKCSYCAEEIQDDAIVCRYCGRELFQTKTIDGHATITQVATLEGRIAELEAWMKYQKSTWILGNSTWKRMWSLFGYNVLFSLTIGAIYFLLLITVAIIAGR